MKVPLLAPLAGLSGLTLVGRLPGRIFDFPKAHSAWKKPLSEDGPANR
jgi:hypothetical protein